MSWKHTKNHFKPPSGIPSNPASTGEGWGGPPKGAGNGRERPAITPETTAEFRKMSSDPVRKLMKAEKAARLAQFLEHLGDLALNAERQETQVSATIAVLNRLDGMPKQKIESDNRDLTLEDLIAEAASKRKAASE